MQPEQQQRIMGYFIEEAKDHLNTIEQGLLSLQNTMEDTEMVNEVFRAAHSVKGGAGMLGISSIHRTAHRLEDCLKVLQESPVQVDSQLESLFLQVFDTLEALVEQLQGPFGLTDETADGIMLEAEPVFDQLNTHLEQLVIKGATSTVVSPKAANVATLYELEEPVPLSAQIQPSRKNANVLPATFKRDVLVELREMLQVFKQQDSSKHRKMLQEHCQSLENLGEEVDLPGWNELLETSRRAIACSENSYRLLASLIIKEIKQAQELALAGRSVEIAPSEQLKALVPTPLASDPVTESDAQELDSLLTSDTNFKTDSINPHTIHSNGNGASNSLASATNQLNGSDTYIQESDTYIQEDNWEDLSQQHVVRDAELGEPDLYQTSLSNLSSSSGATNFQFRSAGVTSQPADPSDPEVGIAELNSLADIFEGQTPDIDQTWQEEEIISFDDRHLASNPTQAFNEDDPSDFSDLIGDLDDFEISGAEASTSEDLMGWLTDEATDSVSVTGYSPALVPQESEDFLFGDSDSRQSSERHGETTSSTTDSAASLSLDPSDFSDLLFEDDSQDNQTTEADDLNNLFGDSFFEEDISLEDDSGDFGLDANAMPELQHQDDDLFAMPATEALNEVNDYGFDEAAFSTRLDNVADDEEEDFLTQGFAGEENASLTFDDSFAFEREDLGSDERQSDDSAAEPNATIAMPAAPEEAVSAESDFDFSDLLEISESDREASASQDELLFGEELGIDDEATDLGLDELALDESVDNFELAATGDFVFSEWESDSTASSSDEAAMLTSAQEASESMDFLLDDSFSDTPAQETESLTDLGLEDILSTDELNSSDSATALDSQELLLDWEEEGADGLDTSATDLEIDESLWNLDEPEVASAQTASAGIDALTSDFDLDTTSTNPFNFDEAETDGNIDDLFENEALSSVETPQNATFNDQEDLGDLFSLPAAEPEALMFEEFDLESLEQPEAIQDFDAFNDFFDTSADSSTSDFDDFSVFDLPTATEQPDSPEVAAEQSEHPEMLVMPEAAFQDELFDIQSPEAERVADSSESLFDASDDALFEDIDTAPQAGAEDLDALFGDETSENTEALDLSPDAVNFEEDLFASNASAQELDFELEPEALFFDTEADEAPQAATEAEDLEAFWDEASPVETDELNVSEENLFETEMASDWELESANEETVDDLLDWDVAGAVEAENLDDFLSAEAGDATDAQDWNFEGDEAAAALGLDWDIADGDAALEDLAVAGLGASALAANAQTPEFDDLEALLADSEMLATESEQLPMSDASIGTNELDGLNEFDDLEALLGEETSPASAALTATDLDGFDDLDALLNEQIPAAASQSPASVKSTAVKADAVEDDFGDLEKLLEQAEKAMGGPPSTPPSQGGQQRPLSRPRPRVFEQTMRVPVKHLDSLSNLVGELVVNRNSLEQDQELLRQFLDNLSHQILALGDVGSRMQDLYERSLLESSLLAGRQGYRSSPNSIFSSQNNHPSGVEYDPLEMDRFTGFHLLSQEMIELIVRVRESSSDIERLVDETDQVARMLRQVTTQLQEGLTRSRMVPFAQTADRLPRAVRDISQKLRKEAQLHVEGRETLIDKMILEHLSDPMTHLINNALTHGIELPEVRRAAGKPATGKITLRAFHQGNQTVISVSDDGAGINPEQVRAKAIERKLITAAEAKTLTNLDLYNFLFHPGFTTKDKEDEYAGRGVGMDVVLTSLSECRGTIHIDSTLGKGTTFTIRLPLTLSICKALCCLSERARIAFPMDGVEDMFDLSSDRVQMNSEGQTCIQWRDNLLPFQPLSELLKYNRQISRGTVYGGKREDDTISIVVLRSAGNFIAIQVDRVLGEQEIVIKQLEGPAPKPVGIAGATVLGDGRIMPIADVLELIDLAMGRIRKDVPSGIWSNDAADGQVPDEALMTKTEPMVLIVDDSITVRELLSMTFSKSGYRVEQARDGQEAWDKLRSGLPCDIVFCDIEMPRMDGLELLSRLQKDETLSNLPIAMLTSRGADRHRQMAAQLGANGYFTKPYLEEVLLEAAQRMIKGEVLFGSNTTA